MKREQWQAEACDAAVRVLGAWASDAAFRASWTPNPADFDFDATCRELAALFMRVGESATSVDVAIWELQKSERLAAAGGVERVEEMLLATPAVLDPWDEVAKLQRLLAERSLKNELRVTLARLESGDVALEDAESGLSSALLGIRSQRAAPQLLGVRSMFSSLVTELGQPVQRELRFTSGYKTIDKATGGLQLGCGWIVGAQTNLGKTSLGIMISELGMANGSRVGFVTGEDPPALFARRMMARRAQVSALALRDREDLTAEDWRRIVAAASEADDAPFMLDARGGKPIERVVAEMRAASRQHGIKLWLVDYIQVFRAQKDFQKRNELVGYVARQLFDCIEGLDCAALFFSQLTMPETKRRPSWEDLRDNKDMAHMASVVLVGFMEKDAKTKASSRVWLVSKNKDGPVGAEVDASFDERTASFNPDADVDTTRQRQLQ